MYDILNYVVSVRESLDCPRVSYSSIAQFASENKPQTNREIFLELGQKSIIP